jgi:hypothetical protein
MNWAERLFVICFSILLVMAIASLWPMAAHWQRLLLGGLIGCAGVSLDHVIRRRRERAK